MKALWNETVIAESDQTVVVEGNHYFPADSIKNEYLKSSNHQTTCFWKGKASYYNIDVNGSTNENAAWYYSEPSEKAQNIKGHVAFWKGVDVIQ